MPIDQPTPWGRIAIGTRLEKQVEADFVVCLAQLLMQGRRKGDTLLLERGKPAHWAANSIIRHFLKDSECDTLWFLDSDADVDPQFLTAFRDFEPGWAYDGLQAFHTRRGWPPEAIWFKRDPDTGDMFSHMVINEGTEDVDMIGTHCALFRREVFEAIYQAHGQGVPFDEFEWFTYPRHQITSDETTLSQEATALGFRLGATTAVKAGHLSKVVTGWETYQEYLLYSGTLERTERLQELCRMVEDITGEPASAVLTKAVQGAKVAEEAWQLSARSDAADVRAFYGDDLSYLYKIVLWNADPIWQQIVEPLREIAGRQVLVVGAGIGGEADILADDNFVDVFELPGALREFCSKRLGKRVMFLEGNTLAEALSETLSYDLVVAIDVIEHIHPDEFDLTMDALAGVIRPGGALYAHNNFKEHGHAEHYDNAQLFEAWVARHGLLEEGEYLWRKP